VGTVNVGSRAPASPLFSMALRERGPTAINGRRPRSGRVSDRADPVPIRRSGVGITSLTDESDKRAISVALFAGKDGGKRMGLKFDRVK
jgi:hypothetical protein